MRYAYAITGALLLGGATATLALQPGGAQTAQNDPSQMAQVSPTVAGGLPSFAPLVAKLQPAVVNISTTQKVKVEQQQNPFAGTPFGDLFGQMQGQQGGGNGGPAITREAQSLGSGFIISPDGYVVTNNHVIAAGAKGATVESIKVTLPDRSEYTARLIGRDETSDLALLKINAPRPLPFVRFGDSTRARVGDWVLAIGNPFGLGGTVTAGIVSALHRATNLGPASSDSFIQTDAAINQGNSGGPMFNLNGDVIGINSQILGSQAGGNIGIGFAIPAEIAKPVIDTLMKGGTIKRGYVGIQIGGPVTDDVASALGIPVNQGELVARVEPNGPAARGGLRAGDVVIRVNGRAVTPDQSLSYLIANVPPGQTARMDVLRNGRPMTVSVVVATRPSEDQLAALASGKGDDFNSDDDDDNGSQTAPAQSPLGVSVQTLTPTIAQQVGVDSGTQGVVVAQVDQARDAGGKLKRGDVISQVNGTPVTTPAGFAAAIAQAQAAGRSTVLLLVNRQRVTGFIPVKIKG